MTLPLTRRRFTVSEYYRMAAAGILTEDDRVELIDGEIVEMAPIGHRHAACVDRLTQIFVHRFADVAQTRVQNPIHLSEHTEPQPDLTLLHPRADFYASGHPTPEDIFLVIEVAETSVEVDRRIKMPLYARSRIPEAWLVDLEQETLTTYRDPTPSGYATIRVLRCGERLAPLAFPDRELVVGDIFGANQ